MFKKIGLLLLALLPFSTAAGPAPQAGVTLSKSNVLVMDAEFTDESVAKVELEARSLSDALPPGKPLYLVLLSPGGSIESGLELIDNLNSLGRPVHTITIFGASMAFQTAQGLDGKRYVTSTGTLMSHKARGSFSGEFPGQLDSRYKYYLRRISKLDERTVERSGGKLTLKSYQDLYENEYWCEGQDCVDAGVADEVTKVQCDKSLNGTKKTDLKFEFLGMPIEVSLVKAACPTITAVLEAKVKVDGKALNRVDSVSISKQLNITVDKAVELKAFIDNKIKEVAPNKEDLFSELSAH